MHIVRRLELPRVRLDRRGELRARLRLFLALALEEEQASGSAADERTIFQMYVAVVRRA